MKVIFKNRQITGKITAQILLNGVVLECIDKSVGDNITVMINSEIIRTKIVGQGTSLYIRIKKNDMSKIGSKIGDYVNIEVVA
jgi:hypothetical protein